jgi:hypothetical protein
VKYAKKKLRDVQDSALQHGFSAIQEARFPQRELGARADGHGLPHRQARATRGVGPSHRTAEEIYVVLAGSGRVKLDDELVELAPLAVGVSPGVARCFQAGPDGLELLIFGPLVESDGEMVHDFWGE